MFATLLASAAALASIQAPNAQREKYQIAEATYVRTVDAQGRVRLVGQYRDSGTPFSFRVDKDGLVRGWVGTEPVKFRRPTAAKAAY